MMLDIGRSHRFVAVAGLLLLGAVVECTTTIATFADTECKQSLRTFDGPNGYPDGTCTALNRAGTYNSFMVISADVGCSVTIYHKDATTAPCSDKKPDLAQLVTCYNTTYVRYSIDLCTPPSEIPSSSITIPSPSASSSPSSTPSSKSKNTGAMIGGVVGGVVAGVAIVSIISCFIYRRFRRAPNPPPKPPQNAGELPDNFVVEIDPKNPNHILPRYELGPRNSEYYGMPAELPSGIEAEPRPYDYKSPAVVPPPPPAPPTDTKTASPIPPPPPPPDTTRATVAAQDAITPAAPTPTITPAMTPAPGESTMISISSLGTPSDAHPDDVARERSNIVREDATRNSYWLPSVEPTRAEIIRADRESAMDWHVDEGDRHRRFPG